MSFNVCAPITYGLFKHISNDELSFYEGFHVWIHFNDTAHDFVSRLVRVDDNGVWLEERIEPLKRSDYDIEWYAFTEDAGKWDFIGNGTWQCSNCGARESSQHTRMRYCPHCGVKMRQ